MRMVEDVTVPLVKVPMPSRQVLVKWRVPDGSFVALGEVIYELEMDDVTYEVETFHSGNIRIIAPEGTVCEVAQVVGRMLVTGMDGLTDWRKERA